MRVALLLLALVGCSPLDHFAPSSPLPEAAFLTPEEHNEVMEGRSWPYVLTLEAGDAAVLYYGSWHTSDPADPQIQQMEALWEEFRPTVAVTENKGGFYLGGVESAVKRLGEFGAVVELASRSEIPVWTLEPRWEDELAYLTEVYTPAEATLFYTLRPFLQERGDETDPEKIEDLARHLLRKRGARPGLEGSLTSIEEMDALWAARFGDPRDWRTIPPDAIHPGLDGTRLQQIAIRVNHARDQHAVRVLLDLARRGERVFAVAGGSHVVKQHPVLVAGLENPSIRVVTGD